MTRTHAEGAATPTPVYIDTPASADRLFTSMRQERLVAVDTEGASFHRYVDRIYLLQLSTQSHHAVIDPLEVTEPSGLREMMESRDVEVVFHDADYDLRLLHQDYGWRVTNIFDTRVAAQLLGIKSFGLAALLDAYFGVRLDKKYQRADWSMRPLSAEMLDYAIQDTMHLLGLRAILRQLLVDKERWHWAQEEFARLEGTQWTDESPETAFMRVKGARDLSRRELALFRELVAWRDAVARQQDRSTFRIAANDVLFDLSRTAPTRKSDLTATRGLNARLVEREAPAILAAIQRGLDVREADLPKFPRAPRWERDPQFDDRVARVKNARDEAAKRLEIDPGVLCSRERMEAVARANPEDLDGFSAIPDLRRWQVEVLGSAFLKALRSGSSNGTRA